MESKDHEIEGNGLVSDDLLALVNSMSQESPGLRAEAQLQAIMLDFAGGVLNHNTPREYLNSQMRDFIKANA